MVNRYLMHELVHKILGGKIKSMVWGITGKEGLSYHVGYLFIVAIMIVISLWVADMFMRKFYFSHPICNDDILIKCRCG